MLRCCNIIGKKVLIMSNKLDFASRLDMAQAKASRISEASEQVMSFQDFSAHHSQGRLSFAATVRNNPSSLLVGAVIGASVLNNRNAGFWKEWGREIMAGAGAAGAIVLIDSLFAPSKPERDLQGYEKYLSEKATKVFEKPTQVEMLQMGLAGLGRGV